MSALPTIPAFAQKLSRDRYFTATIQVLRSVTETDADGDPRTLKDNVVAELPGRIVRGSDPRESIEAERVVSIATWEVRLSLECIEELRRERGCFKIEGSDILQDKATGKQYQVQGEDSGRTEESYLSVTTVKVG